MELQDLISQKTLIDQFLKTPRWNESTHIFCYPRKQTENLSRKKKHIGTEKMQVRVRTTLHLLKKKKNREDRDRLRWELTRLQIKFFKKKSSFLYFGGRWRESKCIVNSLLCRCRDACLSVEVSGIYQGVF